ncbi:hypothetical protein CMUS01_03907 [Colletotrichum musicola]|uniref:Uncharacterized protein n=1 Tax=Colletotrichum musicola TaxID=2175873 RepID=A0A8H6NQ98_9PEZI|nr:hypothetical protein CMUS01_03907 [Colletotrichum musicola]
MNGPCTLPARKDWNVGQKWGRSQTSRPGDGTKHRTAPQAELNRQPARPLLKPKPPRPASESRTDTTPAPNDTRIAIPDPQPPTESIVSRPAIAAAAAAAVTVTVTRRRRPRSAATAAPEVPPVCRNPSDGRA